MEVKFYQVGGCVRDQLLGLKSKDIDFSVEAGSYEIMRDAILARGCDIKVEKPEFVTIRAIDPKLGGVDFVLCRKESEYLDGRRPSKVEAGTLFDDLSRRDFTVNAIAQDDKGDYIDPFGGIADLQKRKLKCVGTTYKRLTEDSLRMLRAIRFHITKNFIFDPALQFFLRDKDNSRLLRNVSSERIREELNKCFAHNTLKTLEVLDDLHWIRDEVFAPSMGLSLESTMKKRK